MQFVLEILTILIHDTICLIATMFITLFTSKLLAQKIIIKISFVLLRNRYPLRYYGSFYNIHLIFFVFKSCRVDKLISSKFS